MDADNKPEGQPQQELGTAKPRSRVSKILLWVLASIFGLLVLAAIIVPNLLRSCRVTANQSSAVGSLRTLNTAEITYSSTYDSGFSATLTYLQPGTAANPSSTAAGLIDSVLATGLKSGYRFTYSAGPPNESGRIDSYSIIAVPIDSSHGPNSYYTDQSGVIRQNSTTTASSTDSPLAG
jgi:type II secretory pathway pseudopilin PulG